MTTKTDTPAAVQTATVAADDLMRAITNAVLSASTDDTLQSLTAIHLRPGHTPGTLMLEATNRYQASQEDIDLVILDEFDSDWGRAEVLKHLEDDHGIKRPEGYDMRSETEISKIHAAQEHGPADDLHTHTVRPVATTELDCLVGGKDLVKLVRTLKLVIEPETKMTHGREAPHVVIEHRPDDGYSGKVSFTLVNNNGTETSVSPKAVHGDFPRIDSMLAEAEKRAADAAALIAKVRDDLAAGKDAGHVAEHIDRETLARMATSGCFNAQYLAVFTKVDTGNKIDTVDIHFTSVGDDSDGRVGQGNPKPMLVRVGQRYRALLVPIRKA